jgi:hypothetical protein
MSLPTFALRVPYLLIGVLAILACAGCSSPMQKRELIPPADPQAQACMASCELGKTQCEGRQQARENECRTQFERLSADLTTCLATPGALCIRPDPCLGADMSICRIQYEECVVGCGGKVEGGFALPRMPWN